MRKYFSLFFLLLIATLMATAHSGKARFHVIIDTDGGLDDMRAITLLLAAKDVEVIGINCSDGVLSPQQSVSNIRALLRKYHHEGIPVLKDDAFLAEPPEIRGKISGILCPDVISNDNKQGEYSLEHLLMAEKEKITMVCLGSLNMPARLSRSVANFPEKLDLVVWFNEARDIFHGMNYNFDPGAFEILSSSGTEILMITLPGTGEITLDHNFWEQVSEIPSRYALKLVQMHNSVEIQNALPVGSVQVWDELAALFLISPEDYDIIPNTAIEGIKLFQPKDPTVIKKLYASSLQEKSPDFKVFKDLPSDPEYYFEDIRPFIGQIINERGLNEWRAGVLTNELHGHLGIYAIIGMKMGVRAREYFDIGLDDLHIFSNAGTTPPVSCMNDGLQVSTGATLGHGLINVSPLDTPEASAIFSFKEYEVRISLKKEISDKISKEVRYGVLQYGLESEEYWLYIRSLAIGYWADLDRNEIFEITIIN